MFVPPLLTPATVSLQPPAEPGFPPERWGDMRQFSTIRARRGKAPQMLQQIAREIGAEVTEDCRRSQAELPAAMGQGRLVAYSDLTGMDALFFDIGEDMSWTIELSGSFRNPITFYAVCKGHLVADDGVTNFTVRPLQGVIHGGFSNPEHTISMRGREGFTGMLLFVRKDDFFGGMNCEKLEIPRDLLEVVVSKGPGAGHFLFREVFHLPIIHAVQAILRHEGAGLLNSSFASARIHEILYLFLNEYKVFTESAHRRVVRRQEQIQLIRDAESILVSRLITPPTIVQLARMVGLNQQTLKQGFRQLFGRTINQYLNDSRLNQAGVLLRAGEMSIRQVAQEVGYRNPGYFSKKFREQFGVTPSHFVRELDEMG